MPSHWLTGSSKLTLTFLTALLLAPPTGLHAATL